jgi:hypothetical protein
MCASAPSRFGAPALIAFFPEELIMNTLADAVIDSAELAAGSAESAPSSSREERNRQRRAWRNSPVNPRNQSRGGSASAWYDHES